MNTAQAIIERFGGVTALARLLGKAPSTVQYWLRTGTIPARWQGPLLALAHERGIALKADDFIALPRFGAATALEEVSRLADSRGLEAVPIPAVELPMYRLADGRQILGLVIITERSA